MIILALSPPFLFHVKFLLARYISLRTHILTVVFLLKALFSLFSVNGTTILFIV